MPAANSTQPPTEKRKQGRPISRIIKLDATPEEVARRIFTNAKPPDPSLRKAKRQGQKRV